MYLTSPLIRERAFLWEKGCNQKKDTIKRNMMRIMIPLIGQKLEPIKKRKSEYSSFQFKDR